MSYVNSRVLNISVHVYCKNVLWCAFIDWLWCAQSHWYYQLFKHSVYKYVVEFFFFKSINLNWVSVWLSYSDSLIISCWLQFSCKLIFCCCLCIVEIYVTLVVCGANQSMTLRSLFTFLYISECHSVSLCVIVKFRI